ncbi:EF-hand calcium-binding domain-containing protein 3 [Balamuthia mandrillaris]
MQASSIWTQSVRNVPTFAKLQGSVPRVDVAVVGAGIVGLSTALSLKEQGKRVAVLEGGSVGRGISAFTTAKLSSLHSLCYTKLMKEVGLEGIRAYADFNERGIDYVERNVTKYAIDCDFERVPNYTFTFHGDMVSTIATEVEAAKAAGLAASFTQETDLPFPVRAAIRVENQAQFNSYAYCLGLARAVQGEGCDVYEHSRVQTVSEASPHRVVTEDGSIEADYVVLATHLPILDRSNHFAFCKPVQSFCMACTLEDNSKMPRAMYITAETTPTLSVRSANNGTVLVVAGGGTNMGEFPSNNSELLYKDLEELAREHFPIKDVVSRWSGEDYMPADSIPYIGYLYRGTKSIFTATGMKKWGLAHGSAAGMLIADLIDGKENREWHHLYDARRWHLMSSLPNLAKFQAKVGAHFVGDRAKHIAKVPDIEELVNDTGAVCKYRGKLVAAYRDPEGRMHAVSPTCTHLGCHLRWNQGDRAWDCPCHGSRFSVKGEVIHGPAVKKLESYL